MLQVALFKLEPKQLTPEHRANYLVDFRIKSTIGIALIVLIAITPFSLNNILQERYFIAIGSLLVTLTCLYIGISSYIGKYNSTIILLTWTPIVCVFYAFSFIEQGFYVTYWSYPAILTFCFMLPMRKAIFATVCFLCTAYVISWPSIELGIFTRYAMTTISVAAFSWMFIGVIDKQKRVLVESTQTDSLTGLLNRASLPSRLDSHIALNRKLGTAATLATIDIDHFKKINDGFGHNTGDQVLVAVSQYLRDNTRRVDELFRIGGEEFLLIFGDQNLEGTKQAAIQLCEGIAASEFLEDHPVTVSIGLAQLKSDENANEWMVRSDTALYAAKYSGRNRICA